MLKRFGPILASLVMVGSVSLLATPAPAAPATGGPGHTRASDLPLADTAHLPVGVMAPKGRPDAVTSLTACSTTCYFYANFAQGPGTGLLADGAVANFSVQSTYLKTTDSFHSLGEMALTGHNAGGTQVTEIGITTDQAVNGDLNPHLFVGAWVNGVFQGYNGGGWTRTAGSTILAGQSLTSYLGTVVNMGWQHFPAGANGQLAGWYGWFQPTGGTGQWFGLFPDTVWTSHGASPTPKIDQAQLYGEVAAKNTTPCSDMGTGDLAVAGQTVAAKISSYTLINANQGATFDHTVVTNSSRYSLVSLQPGNLGFRYGGPGWNSTGTALGTKGAC